MRTVSGLVTAVAGALALQAAGPAATRVQVGYFARGNIRKGTSAGTRASVAGVLLEAGYAFRGGRIVDERSAADVISFDIDGTTREPFDWLIGALRVAQAPAAGREGRRHPRAGTGSSPRCT